MPKKAKELSAIEVGRLTKPGVWAIGNPAGLYLSVKPTGARSWILRTIIAGRRRDHGLGGYPDVPLKDAREEARKQRQKIRDGGDPISERREAQSAARAARAKDKTFRQAAAAYIEGHSHTWKNPKHAAQWSATIETYAHPLLGDLLVRHIEREHIVEVLKPIWTSKTETATRLRGRIEAVLDWATVSNLREGANPAKWEGNLKHLLGKPIRKVRHHQALPLDRVSTFMAALRARPGMSARALEFVALTACRSGEVRLATWEEIDLQAKIWVIPAHRMKAGKEHAVPLSVEALELLSALPRLEGNALVFPAPRGGSLSDMALAMMMRGMAEAGGAVPHGFRSSFRDWAGDKTSYPRDLAEAALAHTVGGVEGAYRRATAIERRRAMMQDWAKFIGTTPAAGGKVVPIAQKVA